MINAFNAWVLHKLWLGDTSARVSFFTQEAGLVHCLYKRGRTPKKQARLQAFQPLWLALTTYHETHYIHALESQAPPGLLLGHALFSGLYINELLYHALSPMTPEPALFDAYALTIKTLQEKPDLEPLLRRFEWALLKACGYSFSWIQDAGSGESIHAAGHYRFIAGEGFVGDKQGIAGTHILALQADNFEDKAVRKSAKAIMRQAIDHLLGGRPLKSRSLITT